MGEEDLNYRRIGEIKNYYGGLYVMESSGKYYWTIKNFTTYFSNLDDWSEIDKELYDSLMAWEDRNPTNPDNKDD